MVRDADMTDDRSLIERIMAGDGDAFKEFVSRYQRLVSHIVFRMVANNSDREDLCQDIFIKVHQNLGGFRSESKVSTWVGRIAYNRCLNFLEKKRVPLYEDICSEHQSLDTVEGSAETPYEFAESSDLSRLLRQEIETLPMHFRTILTLYHLDEMTYGEIAEIMNMPDGTVKSYLFRGRRMLKERLAAKYDREELYQ